MHLKQGVQRMSFVVFFLFSLPLSGCGGAAKPEDAVWEMRTLYQSAESVTGVADITADYGQRVYTYTAAVEGTVSAGTLTVQAPENIAGTVLQWAEDATSLTYEETTLETGALSESGLSPADAMPTVLAACRAGALVECAWEEDGEVLCAEMENPEDESVTVSCRFDAESYVLQRAELAEDGVTVLTLEFSSFGVTLAAKD
ncbi:MAG: hypothetical protein LUD84_10305 [Clostridiales bacterium]|nr:hypothetical protein [Clostridiales bacterium]